MMRFILILLALNLVCADLSSSIYESPIYKRSVDFDAPVIENGEETLNLLNQLRALIPAEETKMLKDLEELIGVSKFDLKLCSYNAIPSVYGLDFQPNRLSSPQKNKRYGENILQYLKYFSLQAVEKCKANLESVIAKAPAKDLKIVEELPFILNADPKEDITKIYYDMSNEDVSQVVLNYLKKNVPDFEKKAKKAASRVEIDEKMEELSRACKSISDDIQPRGFIFHSVTHRSFHENLKGDSFLRKWMLIPQICTIYTDKLTKKDVYLAHFGEAGFPFEKKNLIKNLFACGAGSGGGGDYDPGYVSNASVMASIS